MNEKEKREEKKKPRNKISVSFKKRIEAYPNVELSRGVE